MTLATGTGGRGPVRSARPARGGRDGGGLPGPGHEAGAPGRRQDPPRLALAGPSSRRPVRDGGPRPRRALPPQHPRHPRLRAERRPPLRGHGAAGRRDPAGPDGRRADGLAQGRRDRRRDRRRSRLGPRGRNRPSGPEAGERLHHVRRPRKGPRLRPRQGRRAGHRGRRHRDLPFRRRGFGRRRGRRDPFVHGPRAASGPEGRRPHRHLRPRVRPLRDALREASLRRGHARRHPLGDPPRRAPVPRSHRDAEIPPALGLIVSRCLEKRPEDRFDTAHDLALSLRSISTDQQPAVKVGRAPRPRACGGSRRRSPPPLQCS